jgi:hypothetical protein
VRRFIAAFVFLFLAASQGNPSNFSAVGRQEKQKSRETKAALNRRTPKRKQKQKRR